LGSFSQKRSLTGRHASAGIARALRHCPAGRLGIPLRLPEKETRDRRGENPKRGKIAPQETERDRLSAIECTFG
jgi:hypothetical protein